MSNLTKLTLPLGVATALSPAALAHAGHDASNGVAHVLTSFHHFGGTWIALGLAIAGVGTLALRAVRARSKR